MMYFVVYNICVSYTCWQVFNRGICTVCPMHFFVRLLGSDGIHGIHKSFPFDILECEWSRIEGTVYE